MRRNVLLLTLIVLALLTVIYAYSKPIPLSSAEVEQQPIVIPVYVDHPAPYTPADSTAMESLSESKPIDKEEFDWSKVDLQNISYG